MKLPDKAYEVLKWIVCIVIPACCSFYAFLASRVGLPYGTLVVEIGAEVCTLIGVILGISTAEFRRQNTIEIKSINIEKAKGEK